MKETQRGLTLLEVILAAALVGIVGLSFGMIYNAAQRYMIQDIGQFASQGDASFSMEHIKRKLSRANRIVLYGATGTPPSTARLAFRYDHKKPGGTPNATPENFADDAWDYYRRNADGTLIYLNSFDTNGAVDPAEPGASPVSGEEILARNVVAFTFTQTDSSRVAVNATVRRTTGPETRETQLATSITARGIP